MRETHASHDRSRRLPWPSALLTALCAATGLLAWSPGAPPAAASPPAATSTAAPSVAWSATYLGNLGRTGYTPGERTITPATVGTLGSSWVFHSSGVISDQPAVSNGVAYWGDWSGTEHATSASGKGLWSAQLGQTTVSTSGCRPSTVGVASSATVGTVGSEKVVWTGAGDGTFAALDATRGTILWRTRIAPKAGGFVWSSPAVYHGSIYIGVSSFGDCPLVRGRLVRLDAVTGKILGSFYTVPQGCIGGGIWSSPAIDRTTDSLYVTTGNANCPTPLQNAMLDIDTTTMALKSSWQVPPALWNSDNDWGASPTLFTAEIGGTIRQLVGSATKNGKFYALRRDGLARGPVWQYSVAVSGGCPQCGDGSIAPAAWDGTTLYVAGGRTDIGGQACAGSLDALDPANGEALWQACITAGPVLAAVTAVPGLLFVTAGPDLFGFSSRSGALLFTYVEPGGGSFYGPATVAGGHVYVGNVDGALTEFALPPPI